MLFEFILTQLTRQNKINKVMILEHWIITPNNQIFKIQRAHYLFQSDLFLYPIFEKIMVGSISPFPLYYRQKHGHKAFTIENVNQLLSNHMCPCVPITLQHVNVHIMESVVGNILVNWVSKLNKVCTHLGKLGSINIWNLVF